MDNKNRFIIIGFTKIILFNYYEKNWKFSGPRKCCIARKQVTKITISELVTFTLRIYTGIICKITKKANGKLLNLIEQLVHKTDYICKEEVQYITIIHIWLNILPTDRATEIVVNDTRVIQKER